MVRSQRVVNYSKSSGIGYTPKTSRATKGKVSAESPAFNESEFGSELQALLTSSGKSSYTECDVFSAVVKQQIKSEHSDVLKKFNEAYQDILTKSGRAGERATMYATNHALRRLRVEGVLSLDEVKLIRGKAIGAAQMDSNNLLLGGKESFDLDKAISSATTQMSNYQNGYEQVITRQERRQEARRIMGLNNISSIEELNEVLSKM